MASGDTYQTPSFAWLHALADAGASGVTIVESVTAATPETRLFDQRSNRRVVRSASGAFTIRVDRGAAPREPVDRLVIAGHNLTGHRVKVIKDTNQDGAWSATTEINPYSRLRGSTANVAAKSIHPGVNVIDFPSTGDRYVGVLIDARVTNVAELGECWLTRKRTPTQGLESDYSDPFQPNLAVTRLQSGVDLVRELGSARRSWRIDTSRISGADRLLYEAMLRETGYGRDRVLFDGTTAGYETTIDNFSDEANLVPISGWTTSGVASFLGATIGFDGNVSAEMITSGAAGSAAFYALPTALDLRGCIFRVAVAVDATSFMTATANLYVQLYTSSGYATYQWGTNHILSSSVTYQLSIDVDNDTPSASATTGFDPSNVTTIALGAVVSAGSRTIGWDDVHYIRKDRAPIIARLVPEYGVRQTHPNPAAAGEKRLLSLQIVEDLG